jgi:uncharacterized repeat protein (TIGR01451 family)
MRRYVDRLLASTNKGSPGTHTRTRSRMAIVGAIALVGGALGVVSQSHLTPSVVLHADPISVSSFSACTVAFPAVPAFSESTVLVRLSGVGNIFFADYSDEHALLLGARSANFPDVSPYDPATKAKVNPLTGDPSAKDPTGRPLRPSLFLTDVTGNASNIEGDWQQGGVGQPPTAVYGTWKGATLNANGTSTLDADPAKNGTVGLPHGYPPVSNEGYTSEIQWDVNQILDPKTADPGAGFPNGKPLISGHTYRMQVMDHDGDQNKTGGDAGQACIQVTIANPKLTVKKSSTTSLVTVPGDVQYSYLVTNVGNVTVTNIVATDNNIVAGSMSCPATSLAVGANMTCTAKHTVTQAEIDARSSPPGNSPNLVNTVTVTSSAPTVTDTLRIPIASNPAMTVEKTSTTSLIDHAGQVIPYNFHVTNTGNVTLTGITGSDVIHEIASTITEGVTCTASTLAPGASMDCSGSHTVTQTEMDTLCTVGLKDVVTINSDQTSASDDLTIQVKCTPKLSVVKTSTTTVVDHALQVVPYNFHVTNIGNVTVNNITGDDVIGGTVHEAATCPKATLAPGESEDCTGSHTVTQAEIDTCGFLNDVITIHSTAPDVNDSLGIRIQCNPHMTVTKDVTSAGGDILHKYVKGEVATFKIVATNDGNQTLHNATVADVPAFDAGTFVCSPSNPADLAPTAKITCTGSHTMTQADVDATRFQDTATGRSNEACIPAQTTLTTPFCNASVTVPLAGVFSIDLAKSADTAFFGGAGEAITYKYVVTNNGQRTLQGVLLTDNKTSANTLANGSDVPGLQIPFGGPFKAPSDYTSSVNYVTTANTTTCTPFTLAYPGSTMAPGESTTCTGTIYNTTSTDVSTKQIINVATAVAIGGSAQAQAQAQAQSKVTVTLVPVCTIPTTYNTSPVAFNESGVMKGSSSDANFVRGYYSDEHALTLGGPPGATTAVGPPVNTGSTPGLACALTSARDPSCRPIRPSLFATDITSNLVNNTPVPVPAAGDWQSHRTPSDPSIVANDPLSRGVPPDAIFGTGKTVNASDPAANGTNIPGGDTPFLNNIATGNEKYGSEVRWSTTSLKTAFTGVLVPGTIGTTTGLQANHVYRFQFMVHDGDQNKSGGDVGQACANVLIK